MKLCDSPLIVLDGALGSNLQSMALPPSAWDRHPGCHEWLNRSCPEVIVELHRSFLSAGAMVLETNTFGANSVVLAEYGLQGEVESLNRLAVENARTAVDKWGSGYVLGSIGPTTKLPSLGHITVDELAKVYSEQIRALVNAGVDGLIVETCQDLLQLRTALIAAFDVLEKSASDIPVMASVTIEQTGTMLLGTPISAVAATVEPFPLMSLGLNCATGPSAMRSHVKELARSWPRRISVIPNAGLPEVRDGLTVYDLTPEEFASTMKDFVSTSGVSIVGGCCGTTPEHIRALCQAIREIAPVSPGTQPRPSLSTLYDHVNIPQDIPPLIVGERMNVNGSKKFRDFLLAEDFDSAANLGRQQEDAGAHLLDLSVVHAGRNEAEDMKNMLSRLRKSTRSPIVIDSTTPDVIETALRESPGRCLVNSIHLEDGGATLRRVLGLVKRHGAAVVALAIGPSGMAMTADEKLFVCRKIYDIALGEFGLRPGDLFFDMLTFAIGSGDPSLNLAAAQTLDAVRRSKEELSGAFTILGVSNISFGLPRPLRPVLNSVFLHEAVRAGLTAAIIDSANVLPMTRIHSEDQELCRDFLYDRGKGAKEALRSLLDKFSSSREIEHKSAPRLRPSAEKALEDKVLAGNAEGLEDLLLELLERNAAVDIVNQVLVPTMRRVGESFGSGHMLLPFVLKSAEVMKRAVDLLEPHMTRQDREARTKLLLATVRGDVHDIGKNLVDIIVSNNGYEVHNMGTNVPIEAIVAKAKELQVDAIGLSGLLVKSALVMQESLPLLAQAGITAPVLLGGAALTDRFVATSCAPGHPAPVVYCADAFAGLTAMRNLEAGTLCSTSLRPEKDLPIRARTACESPSFAFTDFDVPEPPFWGVRHEQKIPLDDFLPFLNKQALFRARWGYRRAKLPVEEYAALIQDEVEPALSSILEQAQNRGLLRGRAAHGYFRAHSQRDTVQIHHAGSPFELTFPRQGFPPRQCIADFVRPEEIGGDVIGLFVVGLGQELVDAISEKFHGNAYRDYLLWHGLAVELTEALAEHWHDRMRRELGIAPPKQAGPGGQTDTMVRGARYGFGYPACPDLQGQKVVFALLEPRLIGVELSETMEMIPELTTSAIVLHHPQAKYFAV
jgi:5-methyltetrahydrofolate--homocysteine methyltransferase